MGMIKLVASYYRSTTQPMITHDRALVHKSSFVRKLKLALPERCYLDDAHLTI